MEVSMRRLKEGKAIWTSNSSVASLTVGLSRPHYTDRVQDDAIETNDANQYVVSGSLHANLVFFALIASCTQNGKVDNIQTYRGVTRPAATHYNHYLSHLPKGVFSQVSTTWSADFLQIFSTDGLVSTFDSSRTDEEKEGVKEQQENDMFVRERWFRIRREHAWLNKWFKKIPFSSHDQAGILSRMFAAKGKEELRRQRAQVHAALSVARLAAAVAGITANGNLEVCGDLTNPGVGSGAELCKSMSTVASAAELVAAVCAEAAQSVGASKAHVASVISSGLATRSSSDIATLTAMAETCLRGAATLNLRATSDRSISKYQNLLAVGAPLHVCIESGKIQIRHVSIFYMRDKLILKVGRRHLLGAVTMNEKYRILKFGEEREGGGGGGFAKVVDDFLGINLYTNEGAVELLFKDDKLCMIWRHTIADLLAVCNKPHQSLLVNPKK